MKIKNEKESRNSTKSKTLGYARVSTTKQKEDRQLIALKGFGVEDKNIVVDKVSGKNFERPGYKKLINILQEGDTLVIKSVCRLGRDYEEIISEWRRITKEIKAFIIVVDLPILNTKPKDELDITGVIIADVVLALLGYVSQMELCHLKTRQAEGIAVAKANGVRFGRPLRERPPDLGEYIEKYRAGKLSSRKAAAQVGVPRSTFMNWAAGYS